MCRVRLTWLLYMYLVLGCHPELPRAMFRDPCLMYNIFEGEYVHCTLQGSVFYQLSSLLSSISSNSVNLNPPINLPGGNLSPLFLHLTIDSLLQQEFISVGRGSGCPGEDAMLHQQHSIHQECCGSEAKQSMLLASHV